METFHTLPQPAAGRRCNLTIGNFDGVHLGHQALIGALIEDARAHGRQSGVLTFHPHPAAVLRPDAQRLYLTTVEERIALFQPLGIDFAVVYPFTVETAQTPARDFVQRLQASLGMVSLWVGPDFALGRNRDGTVDTLREMGAATGFGLHVIAPQIVAGEEVHSGRIRRDLLAGDVTLAAQQLGRLYRVAGVVVEGAQRGRTIGFPTANLEHAHDRLLPANGVYATWTTLWNQRLPSVTNIGVRPSFDNGQRTVESHLLDFSGDLYGQEIGLEFVQRLRPEMKFSGIDQLRAQIALDAAAARAILVVG